MNLCPRTLALYKPGIPLAGVHCSPRYTGRMPCTGRYACYLCGETKLEGSIMVEKLNPVIDEVLVKHGLPSQNIPQIARSHLLADGFLPLGDLLVDLYGTFHNGGTAFALEEVGLHGTQIKLTSILSEDQFKSLQDRFNATLPDKKEPL